MMRWLCLALLGSALFGCLDWDSGIRCRTNRHCPDDQVCEDEVCIPATDAKIMDGGPGADGGN